MGSTVVQPGQQSYVEIQTLMHEGMDGQHLFRITVKSNDAAEPSQVLTFKAFFGNS